MFYLSTTLIKSRQIAHSFIQPASAYSLETAAVYKNVLLVLGWYAVIPPYRITCALISTELFDFYILE